MHATSWPNRYWVDDLTQCNQCQNLHTEPKASREVSKKTLVNGWAPTCLCVHRHAHTIRGWVHKVTPCLVRKSSWPRQAWVWMPSTLASSWEILRREDKLPHFYIHSFIWSIRSQFYPFGLARSLTQHIKSTVWGEQWVGEHLRRNFLCPHARCSWMRWGKARKEPAA